MICNKAQKGGGTLAKIIKPIKMIGAMLFCSMFLFGCEERPLRTDRTENPGVAVDLLTQHDGCNIYRFTDGGRSHYFVKCADTKTVSTDSTVPEGKTTRADTIVTVTDK